MSSAPVMRALGEALAEWAEALERKPVAGLQSREPITTAWAADATAIGGRAICRGERTSGSPRLFLPRGGAANEP